MSLGSFAKHATIKTANTLCATRPTVLSAAPLTLNAGLFISSWSRPWRSGRRIKMLLGCPAWKRVLMDAFLNIQQDLPIVMRAEQCWVGKCIGVLWRGVGEGGLYFKYDSVSLLPSFTSDKLSLWDPLNPASEAAWNWLRCATLTREKSQAEQHHEALMHQWSPCCTSCPFTRVLEKSPRQVIVISFDLTCCKHLHFRNFTDAYIYFIILTEPDLDGNGVWTVHLLITTDPSTLTTNRHNTFKKRMKTFLVHLFLVQK